MKKSLIIFFCVFFSCCNKKTQEYVSEKESEIKLVLLNDEISTINTDTLDVVREKIFDDESWRVKNTVSFKIINNSKRKILFGIDKRELYYNHFDIDKFAKDLKENKNVYSQGFYYNIVTDNNKKPHHMSVLDRSDSSIKERDPLEIFILEPNKSKTFSRVLYLPVDNNHDTHNGLLSVFKFDPSQKYDFSVAYISDEKVLRTKLSQSTLRQLSEENIEIYNGILVSNQIPVKFIDRLL